MKKQITISYDFERDNTIITCNNEFKDLPKIHQLDALQDAMILLTNLYNKKIKEFDKGKIEGDYHYSKK